MKGVDDIIAREVAGLEIDCKPGCSWCCHQLIVVTHEADGEAILAAARQRMSDGEFEAFEHKLRYQADEISQLPYSVAEERRWPCPLLKDGQCSVYDVRPVACRSVFSPDNGCCKAMLDANSYTELPEEYRDLAEDITEVAMRIQLTVNNRRPIDGAVELRSLLVSLLDQHSDREV